MRGVKRRACCILALGMLIGGCATYEVTGPEMHVWQVDSMEKVFQDTRPPKEPRIFIIDAAAGEVVSAQFAVRAGEALPRTSCDGLPPVSMAGGVIPAPRARYVAYVPVRKNTDWSAIRRAPRRFPDPLMDTPPKAVPRRITQPVWLTVRVPADAQPGFYCGELTFRSGVQIARRPLSLRVWPVTLPEERTLQVSLWPTINGKRMQRFAGFRWSPTQPEFWELVESYARTMAEHRQTTIYTPISQYVRCTVGPDGGLAFDFTIFDRWVRTFRDAGVMKIEGSHLAHGPYDTEKHHTYVWSVKDGGAVKSTAPAFEKEAEAFLAKMLPALRDHLRANGWLDDYLQHVMDEPTKKNAHRYAQLASVVRQHAPDIRIIDALRVKDLTGSVDVWVPQLDLFAKKRSFYRRRQAAGDEVWFYTCLGPRRPYMNRFIDYPLLKTRMLHWLASAEGASGYLHWGWNQWAQEDPFNEVEDHGGYWLPAGDSHIVYPAPGGRAIDSIRYEAMLEGIQDYELLEMLRAKDPAAADRIIRRIIRSPRRYSTKIEKFRAARRELLEALSQ